MHGPHPTTGHRLPGHLCPLRPCRCDTAHSQCEHLATRASGACGQGVGAPSPLSKISSLKDGPEKRSFPKAGRLETIAQMDGNESVASESESEEEEGGNKNVNDDESVHRLKGEGRPINSVDRRLAMLAGLAAVDWVVSYAEDTPEALLSKLKPDVLVKGGDYGLEEVVGADIVREYGGEVAVLNLVEDCSTTAIAEKIRNL